MTLVPFRALGALAAAAALLLMPGAAAAQETGGWTPHFRASLQTGFDDNPFRLSPGQRARIGEGRATHQEIEHVRDVVTALRVRGEGRGNGLAGRRLRVGGELDIDAYALNRRRSMVKLGAFGRQQLANRDEVRVAFAFTPAEFQRSYLTGSGPSGEPEYGAGEARRMEGNVDYRRRLVRSRRGSPELNADVRLFGQRRSYEAVPWRDIGLLGARLRSDVELADRWTALASVEYARASHDPQPEPVVIDGTVQTLTLDRDYGQLELGGRVGYRLDERRTLSAGYERRTRAYNAPVEESQVYGGRRDVRQTFTADLRLGRTGPYDIVIGGLLQDQTTRRPARGETGDEIDYRRVSGFVRIEFPR